MQILKLISLKRGKYWWSKHFHSCEFPHRRAQRGLAVGAPDNQYSIFHHTIEHRCFHYYLSREAPERDSYCLELIAPVCSQHRNSKQNFFRWNDLCDYAKRCVGRRSFTCIDFEASAMEIVINQLALFLFCFWLKCKCKFAHETDGVMQHTAKLTLLPKQVYNGSHYFLPNFQPLHALHLFYGKFSSGNFLSLLPHLMHHANFNQLNEYNVVFQCNTFTVHRRIVLNMVKYSRGKVRWTFNLSN